MPLPSIAFSASIIRGALGICQVTPQKQERTVWGSSLTFNQWYKILIILRIVYAPAIKRTDLYMSHNTALLEKIVEQLEKLPEVPHTALQVNQMLENPDTDAHDLAKVITQDPALTSKVLKLCNSSKYGFSRKIATISEAVSALGYKELKNLIFTVLSHGLLNRPLEGYGLEKGDLWENAVTCGSFARYIAKKVGFKDVELAFIAALLRDIGKIGLQNYLMGNTQNIENNVREGRYPFSQAEDAVLGASHTSVGSSVAQRWNLPESLQQSIAWHHQPSLMPDTLSKSDAQLVCIVHLADVYTMLTGSGLGIDGLLYPLDTGVFSHLNIPQDNVALEQLYAELLDLNEEIHQQMQAMLTSLGGN